MPQTARAYLVHRFRGDAVVLTDRVAALQRGLKIPGPDATTSRRMADACEAVAAMIESIAPQEHAAQELHAIVALIPLLEQRARDAGMVPPVRAVYAGAATRIREVQIAEAAVAGGSAADIDDEDMDDDDLDDDDLDDDDLDDDDLDAAHDVPPDGAVSS
ncbi:MAG: hypothetical protein ACOVRP_03100 [Gemmatimonas sp.]